MKERTPKSPPRIMPLLPGEARPRWSVMIPAYNCSRYLAETIESVLARTGHLENMQIEVIDDKSTDANVAAIVREAGRGKVGFFQQEVNVGSLRNFETCINRAKGHWVHILHGDDKITPGFYNEVELLFTMHPEAGAVFTGVQVIDEKNALLRINRKVAEDKGILADWLRTIAIQNLIQPPQIVIKRSVYETLGSFFGVHYGEDWEMWVRIAAHYPVAYSPAPLAIYRYLRQDSISNSSIETGGHIRDIATVIDIIQDYLPLEDWHFLKAKAKEHYSQYAANCANQLWHNGASPRAAIRQATSAVQMHVNKSTVTQLLKLYAKDIITRMGLSHFIKKAKAKV